MTTRGRSVDMTTYVGFKGDTWSTSTYAQDEPSPEEAAAAAYEKATQVAMPHDAIRWALGLTNNHQGFLLELVGDGNKPEGWKRVSSS